MRGEGYPGLLNLARKCHFDGPAVEKCGDGVPKNVGDFGRVDDWVVLGNWNGEDGRD